jgi:hypothetical protein
VNVKNLVPYDPIFNTIVPPEERATREQLERIITSYFQGLTDHKPIEADYDPHCDRFHSGIESHIMHLMAARIAATWDVMRAI